jgi:hypothetical protein
LNTPAFFADAPTIGMVDPLAEFLGAATGGSLTYNYIDAVKLAGHSCPTVAGAYLMTKVALEHLYGADTPVRGEIKVSMRDAQDEGVTGVIGNVIGLITGATGSGGFKGIGGRFNRAGLLQYGVAHSQSVRFTRMDNGLSIGADFDASHVAPDPRQMQVMQALMSGNAGPEDLGDFGKMWQTRVGTIMTSAELWQKMVKLS